MTYEPKVNDYVMWEDYRLGMKVGFTLLRVRQNQREVGSQNRGIVVLKGIRQNLRPICEKSTFLHKRIHVCICCYESNWS